MTKMLKLSRASTKNLITLAMASVPLSLDAPVVVAAAAEEDAEAAAVVAVAEEAATLKKEIFSLVEEAVAVVVAAVAVATEAAGAPTSLPKKALSTGGCYSSMPLSPRRDKWTSAECCLKAGLIAS